MDIYPNRDLYTEPGFCITRVIEKNPEGHFNPSCFILSSSSSSSIKIDTRKYNKFKPVINVFFIVLGVNSL